MAKDTADFIKDPAVQLRVTELKALLATRPELKATLDTATFEGVIKGALVRGPQVNLTIAAIVEQETEAKKPLTDEQVLNIFEKAAKNSQESGEGYAKAMRHAGLLAGRR